MNDQYPADPSSDPTSPLASLPVTGEAPEPDGRTDNRQPAERTEPMAALTSDPAELVRIGTMLSRLNNELRQIDLDQPGTSRLQLLHRQVIEALADNLNEDLVRELHSFVPGLGDDQRSESEVRLAHLQLVGWMEGLFQGIQLAAVGQQLNDRAAAAVTEPAVAPHRAGVYL